MTVKQCKHIWLCWVQVKKSSLKYFVAGEVKHVKKEAQHDLRVLNKDGSKQTYTYSTLGEHFCEQEFN